MLPIEQLMQSIAGATNNRSISSPNCAEVLAWATYETFHLRAAVGLAFLVSGAMKIGVGLGCIFCSRNPKDQIFPRPLPTLLSSEPKETALSTVTKLTHWAD